MKSNGMLNILHVFAGEGADDSRSGERSISPVQTAADDREQRPASLTSSSTSSESGRPSSSLKRWLKIVLSQLPADGRVRISLRNDQAASWAMGDANADLVGIAVETASRNTALKLNNFIVNKSELIFSTYAACDEIRLAICVQCIGNEIRGYVDLPLGASATFQSNVDRTSLVGLSSFSLSFSE